jgi:hypothetical protein
MGCWLSSDAAAANRRIEKLHRHDGSSELMNASFRFSCCSEVKYLTNRYVLYKDVQFESNVAIDDGKSVSPSKLRINNGTKFGSILHDKQTDSYLLSRCNGTPLYLITRSGSEMQGRSYLDIFTDWKFRQSSFDQLPERLMFLISMSDIRPVEEIRSMLGSSEQFSPNLPSSTLSESSLAPLIKSYK